MGDCLQGHNWRPSSRMVCLGTSALVPRHKFCTKEMSCLCFPSSHQFAPTLPSHPAPTDTQPRQSTAGSSKNTPHQLSQQLPLASPSKLQSMAPSHHCSQKGSPASVERDSPALTCQSSSLTILPECQERQAGLREKTDGLTHNSRPPRTLSAFSPRQCCRTQRGEGMGLREPKKDLNLKVPLTEGPALPGCSGIPSLSSSLLGNTQAPPHTMPTCRWRCSQPPPLCLHPAVRCPSETLSESPSGTCELPPVPGSGETPDTSVNLAKVFTPLTGRSPPNSLESATHLDPCCKGSCCRDGKAEPGDQACPA